MSYCVNCGVELGEAEKSCPLCDTVVINPRQAFDENITPPYPSQAQKTDLAENKKLTVLLISALLALPVSICLVCNYVIDATLDWSLYVVGAMGLLWTFLVPPYLLRRNKEILTVIIGTFSVCLFMRFVEEISPIKGWYLTLALPIVLVVAFICLIMVIILLYSNLRKLQIAAILALFVSGLMIAIEIATDVYDSQMTANSGEFKLEWSLFVTIPCILLTIICLLIDRKRAVKENIKKRFHV